MARELLFSGAIFKMPIMSIAIKKNTCNLTFWYWRSCILQFNTLTPKLMYVAERCTSTVLIFHIALDTLHDAIAVIHMVPWWSWWVMGLVHFNAGSNNNNNNQYHQACQLHGSSQPLLSPIPGRLSPWYPVSWHIC